MNQDEHDKAKRELGFPFDSGSDSTPRCGHVWTQFTVVGEVAKLRCLYCPACKPDASV